jgi:hypothetical protein
MEHFLRQTRRSRGGSPSHHRVMKGLACRLPFPALMSAPSYSFSCVPAMSALWGLGTCILGQNGTLILTVLPASSTSHQVTQKAPVPDYLRCSGTFTGKV